MTCAGRWSALQGISAVTQKPKLSFFLYLAPVQLILMILDRCFDCAMLAIRLELALETAF